MHGCFSAGDTLDEALSNAPDAVSLWLEEQARDGHPAPPARTPSAIKADPEFAEDLRHHAMALVPVRSAAFRPAAE